MSLEARLDADLKEAMRARDAERRSVIQMIRSQIQLEKKKDGADSLDDARVVRLVQAHVKKIEDAIGHAERAGREDLVASNRSELGIARVYLPAELPEPELKAIADAVVRELGVEGPSGMGAAMKETMARVAGRADGKRVQQAVRRALGTGG